MTGHCTEASTSRIHPSPTHRWQPPKQYPCSPRPQTGLQNSAAIVRQARPRTVIAATPKIAALTAAADDRRGHCHHSTPPHSMLLARHAPCNEQLQQHCWQRHPMHKSCRRAAVAAAAAADIASPKLQRCSTNRRQVPQPAPTPIQLTSQKGHPQTSYTAAASPAQQQPLFQLTARRRSCGLGTLHDDACRVLHQVRQQQQHTPQHYSPFGCVHHLKNAAELHVALTPPAAAAPQLTACCRRASLTLLAAACRLGILHDDASRVLH